MASTGLLRPMNPELRTRGYELALMPLRSRFHYQGREMEGGNPTFGIDLGNEFRVKIFGSTRCTPAGALSDRVKTGWDGPFHEAVVNCLPG